MRSFATTSTPQLILSALVLTGAANASAADEATGWIGNDHTSAYTLDAGEFELSGGLSRVDETIDFLDLRDDMLAGNSRLIDNSGDLDGVRGEARLGIWRGLEVFYKRHDFDLTLKTSPTTRANIVDLSNQLSTTQTSWGAKFVLYESEGANNALGGSSFALDLRRVESESDDFDGYIESFRLNANSNVSFDPPQRFAMDRLSDEGWQARLLYSNDLGSSSQFSIWAGYGESDASSGTSTDIDFAPIADQFLQTFDIEETQYMAGASINLQGIPRLPIQIGYEYIKINKREAVIESSNSSFIPSFLRGSNIQNSADTNHTAYGTVSWWITPHMYTSLSGKLFKNQFVGIMPHYNNPLSASFSETLYGYVTLSLGLKFTR